MVDQCNLPSEPDDMLENVTRSPSTGPRSLLTHSSRSRANSSASSIAPTYGSTLLPLQTKGPSENDTLEPLAEEEYDPASFDLIAPRSGTGPQASQFSLEQRSEQLFSVDHLRVIFDDPLMLQRFTNFLHASRPRSMPLLVYYLDSLKALKAIRYSNAITQALAPLEGLEFSNETASKTINQSLLEKANKAFETLAREDLPAYITDTWIQTVSVTVKRRIADTLPAHLRDLSEGLAEVFCLTDPSRPDNPIVFASEEFNKTTQYGMGYVLGRNCRFLQGPKTNPDSIRRIKEKVQAGEEHCETFLNYRRDGSPFMNLIMIAPLFDSRGVVRYHIGAQVDVSGLVKECAGLEAFERLVAQGCDGNTRFDAEEDGGCAGEEKGDDFRELAEMFNLRELKTVRESGGIMYRVHQEDITDTEAGSAWNKPRLVFKDDGMMDRRPSDPVLQLSGLSTSHGGRLRGIYQHYLLVRPHPNLKILFASPSMRVPGILQSNFLARIGGSRSTRDAIEQALADGHGVTAKIRWLKHPSKAADSEGYDGKGRWIHCTPLLGGNGAVGVWMVVLVDDEHEASSRRTRDAPPVDRFIGRRRNRQFDAQGRDEDTMSLSSFAAANRVLDEHRPLSSLRRAAETGHMASKTSFALHDDLDLDIP
ncbi:hypothetical protein F4780DRAFT_664836 [Xylariomycetidae sp. FL0641]|nr:hypothetical protein F4780DRAFT_664836 [Xylariomycetidae sp. FL0641]